MAVNSRTRTPHKQGTGPGGPGQPSGKRSERPKRVQRGKAKVQSPGPDQSPGGQGSRKTRGQVSNTKSEGQRFKERSEADLQRLKFTARGQGSNTRGQRPDQRSGVQTPEVRCSNTTGQMFKHQRSLVRVQGSYSRGPWSDVKVHTPEVRGSNTRGQWSVVRGQGSGPWSEV